MISTYLKYGCISKILVIFRYEISKTLTVTILIPKLDQNIKISKICECVSYVYKIIVWKI